MPQVVGPAASRSPGYRPRTAPAAHASPEWDEEAPPGSPIKAWATHLAILGALGGGVLVFLLKWTDMHLLEAMAKVLPDAEPGKIFAALYGSIAGMTVGGLIVLVVGRSWESVCGFLLTAVAGGLYGALAENPIMIGLPGANGAVLILGALGGILVGALLGVMIGAIIAVARG
jgi:hypothetical protein